jgi:hypothetical protein
MKEITPSRVLAERISPVYQRIIEKSDFTPALPLLEHDYSVNLLSEFNSFLKNHSKTSIGFPFDRLVSFALNSRSDYWSGSALNWISGGFPIDTTIRQSIHSVSEDKCLSQSTRHRAYKLFHTQA